MKKVSPTRGRRSGFARSLRLTTGLTLVALGFALYSESRAEVAAVASRAFNGYKRTKLPDKSFQPETYAFAPGGRWDAAIAGDSLDEVDFMTIARTLKGPLASRGYVMEATKDPEKTDLLIFVFWGATQGTDGVQTSGTMRNMQNSLNQRGPVPRLTQGGGGLGQSGIDGSLSAEAAVAAANMDILEGDVIALMADNRYREKLNERNAGILGFQDNLQRAYLTNFTTAATDLMDDLQASRYFVVLKAYDFRLAWKVKRRKVLWETRFSIAQHGNDFGEQLAGMAQQASKHFGVHTHGLVRESLPDVQVTYGEARVMKDDQDK
jgi:hypothetical protein